MNGLTLKLFFVAFFVFILTDMVWLGYIAKNLYLHHYAPWFRIEDGQLKFMWWAASLVYLLLALGVVVFVLPLAQSSPLSAACYGAILGAVTYGIFDFTCLAIFKDFPVGMGMIDWLWGIVVCSWTSTITTIIGNWLK